MFRFLVIPLIVSINVSAQVKLSGKMLHYTDQKKVKYAQINVIDTESGKRTTTVVSGGNYHVKLDRDKKYRIEYAKQGYYNKHVLVDTRGVPSGKKLPMYIDMDMVAIQDSLDGSIFDKPMGLSFYDASAQQMAWNLDYSRQRFEEVNAAFRDMSGESTEKKEDTDVNIYIRDEMIDAQDEEPRLYDINPFRYVFKVRKEIHPIPFRTSDTPIKFKHWAQCGMLLTHMALTIDDDGTDARIGLVRQLDYLIEKGADFEWDSKQTQIDLANSAHSEKEMDQIFADYYFALNDSIEEHLLPKIYVSVGAWLEANYHAVDVYQDKPSKELNTFIGQSRDYISQLMSALIDMVGLTDAELSLVSDLRDLNTIYQKIEYKPGGEMVTSDKLETPHFFAITPELYNELWSRLKVIHGNFR